MSLDIFVQRFQEGDAVALNRADFEEIFGPYAIIRRSGFMRVDFPDGSAADIYVDEGDPICLMFNHCGGEAFYAALHELADRTKSLIFWPDIPPRAAATDPVVLPGLPIDLVKHHAPIRIVESGKELSACIGRP